MIDSGRKTEASKAKITLEQGAQVVSSDLEIYRTDSVPSSFLPQGDKNVLGLTLSDPLRDPPLFNLSTYEFSLR